MYVYLDPLKNDSNCNDKLRINTMQYSCKQGPEQVDIHTKITVTETVFIWSILPHFSRGKSSSMAYQFLKSFFASNLITENITKRKKMGR